MRLGAALGIVAALAVVQGPSAAVKARSAARAAAPVCRTPRLVIWLDTRGNGTAGSVYYHLEFANLSDHVCTLRGHPGVSAVGLAGQRLGTSSAWMSSTVRTIRLAPGAIASALLRVVEAGNYPRSRCHPTLAAGLRVYPPGDTVSKVAPFPLRACASAGPQFLGVGAIAKGGGA